MILALDIGNSQIHGGVFDDDREDRDSKDRGDRGDRILAQFRKTTKQGNASDELGVFFRSVLRENGLDPARIRRIAICSVVPDVMHSVTGACVKYFGVQPFVLQSGVKTGLNIRYRNPAEVGADRIANAVAAVALFPGKNLIIADFGTATTYCAVTKDREYLGGLILPGLRISMEALESRAAKLPSVEIQEPPGLVGRSTIESIQSGLFHGNLHALRGISRQIQEEHFREERAFVLGTGGFSRLFEKSGIFDALIPELVLLGLNRLQKMNE